MSAELELDELFGGRSKKQGKTLPVGEWRTANATISPESVPEEVVDSSARDEVVSGPPSLTSFIETEPVSTETSWREGVHRTGRPPKPVGDRYVDRVKRAAYYVDVDTLDRLDEFCRRSGLAKSEVVRDGIALYLARHEAI